MFYTKYLDKIKKKIKNFIKKIKINEINLKETENVISNKGQDNNNNESKIKFNDINSIKMKKKKKKKNKKKTKIKCQ